MAQGSKKKATILNMIIMVVYQVVTVAFGFIVPRMLMITYGAPMHGYTSTVNNIMGYIALLNAGLAAASVQSLYAPLAKKDKASVSANLNAINHMYIRTGIYYTIAVTGCAVVLPFIIGSEIPTYEVWSLMLIMGATNTLECFIYSKYRVLLQADQRLYVVTVADIFALILRGVLQVGLIHFECSIILVQAVPLVMVFLRMLILSLYVKKNYGYLDKKITPNYGALSKRYSVFVHQITTIIVNNTDIMILTFYGQLVAVSIYSVYNLVCVHINTLLSFVFQHSIVASFGQLYSENKDKRFLKNYRAYEYTYFLVITIVFSATEALLYPFVSLYTHAMKNINYADWTLVFLFVAVGVANNIRIPCLTMINAAGMFKETQLAAIIEAVLNISISLVLVNFIGIYGLLIGTICSFAYRTTDIIRFTNKHILGVSPVKSFLRALRVIAVIALNCVITHFAFLFYNVNSWLNWVVLAICVTAVVSVITLIVYTATDFKEMKGVIKIFMHPKKKAAKSV